MADPISVTASIVTLVGAFANVGNSAVDFVKSLKDAPTDLILLANEISDVNVFLEEIRANVPTLNLAQIPPESTTLCDRALALELRIVGDQLRGLTDFVRSLRTIQIQSGRIDVDRIGWVAKKKQATKLRKRLEKSKNKLNALLSASTASSVHRIEAAVGRLAKDVAHHRNQYADRIDSALERIQLSEFQQEASQSRHQSAQSQVDTSNSSALVQMAYARTAPNSSTDNVGASSSATASMQFQWDTSEQCDRSCSCVCHLRSRTWWKSPTILQNLIGFIFLNFSGMLGLSIMKPACSSIECKSFSISTFRVTYCLPRWLLMKAVHFAIGRSEYGEIHIMPFIQRRTEEFELNSIYHAADRGNISEIAEVLRTRAAMPNDATDLQGATALHFAVKKWRFDAIKFLLREGAKMDLEDDKGITVVQSVWQRIFTTTDRSSNDIREMIALFPETTSMRSFEFSDLHKSVLGIFPIKTELQLLIPKWREQVNFTDAWGCTPLHWAAWRGDTDAVKALLLSGAHVNIRDKNGLTALHLAVYRPYEEPLKLLLLSGSDPSIEDYHGATALHYAAAYGTVSHVKALLEAGTPINIGDERDDIPFTWAVHECRTDIGQYLLEEGADINHVNTLFGNPIVFAAVSSHAYKLLDVMLKHNVNITPTNLGGETLLHFVARWADIRIFDILRTHMSKLSILKPADKNVKGQTAHDILQTRINVPDGVETLFNQLMRDIEILYEYREFNVLSNNRAFWDKVKVITDNCSVLFIRLAFLSGFVVSIFLYFYLMPFRRKKDGCFA